MHNKPHRYLYKPNKNTIIGGQEWEQDMCRRVIDWCMDYFYIDCKICLTLGPYRDCYGWCKEGKKEHTYDVFVAFNQDLRDYIATLVHELVHVKQWETGEWKGTGEKEAEKLQYKLTDKLWKNGTI